MPLVVYRCGSCGAEVADIVGAHIADSTPATCGCLAPDLKKVPGGGIAARGYDYDNLDPLEREAVLAHRKWMEENHHLRDSGEITVSERGPDWARPFGNAPRARRYY
jgi:hypothetical protein